MCSVHRYAGVLVWLPILVLAPLLNLGEGPAQVAFRLLVVVVMAAACVTAVFSSDPVRPSPPQKPGRTSYVALGVLAAAVVVGSTQGVGWVSPWILLIITTPVVVHGWAGWAAIPVIGAGAALVSWLDGDRGATFVYTAIGVLLAGVATTSFLRLGETIEELRRTRTELARVAVVEERERFSRDLHDLLGHTLSVMVVKAEAVRRLAGRDPEAAAAHAADIEKVGRQALVDVRQAVDAMRAPTLHEELEGARRALEAAGIRAEVSSWDGPVGDGAGQTLAWVVREGVTNVLRHSGAGRCRVELSNGNGALRVSVSDDGVGGPPVTTDRQGGLDGLRRRVLAAGGRLEVEPGADGFRLVASVPTSGPTGGPTGVPLADGTTDHLTSETADDPTIESTSEMTAS